MFKRISLLLTISNGVFNRTRSFEPEHLYTTPHVEYSNFDEVLLVCTDKKINQEYLNFIDKLVRELKVPLAISGNVNSVDDAKYLFDQGADRIVINRSLWNNNINIIKNIANIYGKQSIIASIDFLQKGNRQISYNWAEKIERNNLLPPNFSNLIPYIGEILLQDVDQDGRIIGANLSSINKICSLLPKNVPIHIGSCGLMDWQQYADLLTLDFINAVAVSNVHHMSKTALKSLRNHCIMKKIDIRN